MWPEDDVVCVLRTSWPSSIQEAEERLAAAGIPFELVELFDGEEWEFRVPRTAEEAARDVLSGMDGE